MRDFDDLFGMWEPVPPRRSPATDLLDKLARRITPENWLRRTLHGNGPNGQWAGCLLGHVQVLYGGPYEVWTPRLPELIKSSYALSEAVEALATVALRAERQHTWQRVLSDLKARGDWNVEAWCGMVAAYNDSAPHVGRIHLLIDDAIRFLYDTDLRPYREMRQRHVVDRILEEKVRLAEELVPPLVAISESGEYPPISPVEEDKAKVVPIPAWDADAEFTELLAKEPVAA